MSYIRATKESQRAWSADDVRVDTFRASGAGGQHRNKTDSGVRLTYLPLGIVVTATEDRSQHVNRKVAWERLEAIMDELALSDERQEVNAQRIGQETDEHVLTWTDWRDEVKGSRVKTSMKRALKGRLSPLLK